jgi:hypothetical protein
MWNDSPSTMRNDTRKIDGSDAEVALAAIRAYEWGATTGPDDATVFPQAASSSSAAHASFFNTQPAAVSSHFDTLDDTSTFVLGDTNDGLRAVEGTGASGKAAPRSRAVVVDRSVLDSMLHLPRDKAAKILGLCSTTFKKVCRRAGLQGWPYRRPLLGFTPEDDVPMSFSKDISSQHSHIQQPHALLARAPSAPVRRPSDFAASSGTLPQTASQPMPYTSIPRSFSTSDNASGSFKTFDGAAAPRRALITSAAAAALHALETPSGHVVDAVMDYLDTLSSGGGAGELEAVVAAMDSTP